MNQIYKIIWSKAAEAYVVTSELAKSHTKSPSGKGLRRSVTAALLAAMVAAPVAFGVYAAGDTHYVSVKSGNQTADSNYNNDGAQAENSVAIGPSVKTTGKDNIVIGSGEIVSQAKKDGTSVDGTRVLVVGHGNYFQPTSEWDSMKGQGVSYRDAAIIGHGNRLLQGDKNDAGGWSPAYQLVHGWENTLKGSFTGAIGYKNEIKNSSRPNNTSQNMAFTIGTENTIDATGYYMGDKNRVNTLADYKEPGSNPNKVGADLYVIGRHNIIGSTKGADWYVDNGHIIGSENIVYSNDANVFGWLNKVYASYGMAIGDGHRVGVDDKGNLVKNKYGQAIYNPVAVGRDNAVTGDYGVAVGNQAKARGEKATAVGSTAQALGKYSAALGTENRAKGYGSVAVGSLNNKYDFDNPGYKWIDFDSGKYSNAIGVMNISKGESSSAIGTKNKALGEGASSFGYLNTAAGGLSSAVGYWNKAEGEKSSSFGYLNIATGKQSSALGFRNYATAENSAAIGIYNNKYNVVKRKWEDQTAGDYSVAIGAKNHSAGGYSSALGYENMSGGIAASAVGYRNITDGQSASALGYANIAASTKSSAVGYRNFISGYGAVAVGSENNLNFVKDYQATGVVESGDLSSALGISNATIGRKSAGIGNSNYALGTKSVGVGLRNYATGYESLAMGHYSVAGSETLDQVKYPVAIGSRAKSTITDAVAIGSFSNTTRDKGDYGYDPSLKKVVTEADITTDTNIGTYRAELEAARSAWQTSVEDAEIVLHKIQTQQYETKEEGQQLEAQYDQLKADSEQKQQAYDAAQKKVSDLVGAWQGQMAALSVGDEATGRTRQITGVAAGSADTDAVNVAQLKAIDRRLAQGAIHYYSVTSDKKATGSNFDNDGAKADDSMVIGIGSTSEAVNSTVIGNNNTLTGGKRDSDGVRRNNSIVVGESLEVEGTHNAVFGTDYMNWDRKLTKVAGEQNTVIGVGNLVGYTAEKDLSDPRNPKWTYTKLYDRGSDANVAVGMTNTVNGGSVVLGTSSEIKDGATLATSVGHANTIQGSDQYGLALGNNLLVEGYGAIAVGTDSKATADDATAIGTEAVAEQAGSIAFGHAAEAKNEYSIAFGLFAKAKARSGVAIGSSSLADREKGSIGYLAGENTSEVWKATKGAISVGNKGKKYTRQITGVAAGTEDTDAVNVAQLKAVEGKITQTGTEAQKHTSVAAGTNISVTEDGTNNEGGKNYKVSLAKDIDLGADGSIKAGNTTINNDGLTVQGGPSVTTDGIDAGKNVITNVAAGTKDTDAVNVSQLKAVQEIAAAKTTIEAGDNIKVEKGSAKGSYKISATDTTLQKGNNALSLNGSKLNLSVKDTKGNEVTGSVDLEDLKGAVNTDTTYTLESEENDNNTTTIFLKGSDKKEQQVTVATKDTRNTIVDSDTVTVKATKQEDGSNEYKLNVKTDGKVEKGNTGIVTGGTVYNETRIENDGNYIKAENTAGQNLIALDKQVGANTTNIAELNNRVYDMGNRVDRVGAGAAALAGLHPLDFDPDDKWDFAAGYGNYKGAHALAIGAFYRPNESKMFSVGGSFGGGENMLNIGFSMKVGRGNEYMKLTRSEMAQQLDAQAKKLDEQAQKLDAQTQKLDAQDEQIRDMQAEMKAITQKLATLQAQSGK
ncbi:MAG: YadA-like family protein [Negativicoccus succinicivorans]|nr:ESPR-type extended signal peptide-containing protein [Negativicoccus succinicivorans]MBS5917936.1 YadA-like family protein [Negativicoccus succinicivorans]